MHSRNGRNNCFHEISSSRGILDGGQSQKGGDWGNKTIEREKVTSWIQRSGGGHGKEEEPGSKTEKKKQTREGEE